MTDIYLRFVARVLPVPGLDAEKHARSAQPYHSGESFRAKKAKGDLRGHDQKVQTMHDSDLPTFLTSSLPIIFKRTAIDRWVDREPRSLPLAFVVAFVCVCVCVCVCVVARSRVVTEAI